MNLQKIMFLSISILLIKPNVFAETIKNLKYLSEGHSYRNLTDINVCTGPNDNDCNVTVDAQSSLLILDDSNASEGIYPFKLTKSYEENNCSSPFKACLDKAYVIKDKKIKSGVPITKNVIQRASGMVSGPLIIPFKWRLDDDSLVSDATLGIYVGWGFSTKLGQLSHQALTFTPFISAGLSQISVPVQSDEKSNKTETRAGFTWSTGILIKNWDGVNIGLVYGQDRIGDKDAWTHEGKGWLSLSVNWQI